MMMCDDEETAGEAWIVVLSYIVGLLTTLIVEVMRTRRHRAALKRKRVQRKHRKQVKSAAKCLRQVQEVEAVLQRYTEVLERIEAQVAAATQPKPQAPPQVQAPAKSTRKRGSGT